MNAVCELMKRTTVTFTGFISLIIISILSGALAVSASTPHASFHSGKGLSVEDAKQYYLQGSSVSDDVYGAFREGQYGILSGLSRTEVHALEDYDLQNAVSVTAEALNYDPDLIFEFVQENMDIHPVFGESKGAFGCLLDFHCSPFDQVRLTLLLLEEANSQTEQSISAKIHIGSVRLTSDQWEHLYGFKASSDVCAVLANGAIPSSLGNCDSVGGDINTIDIGHAWLSVTYAGTTQIWDPAFKKRTRHLPAGLVTNFSPNPLDANLVSANSQSGYTTAGSIPYLENIDTPVLEQTLTDQSEALYETIKDSNLYSASLRDLTGGYEISRFEQDPNRAPLEYTSWYTAGLDDIPDVYRIMIDFSVTTEGHPAGSYYPILPKEEYLYLRMGADELYGRLFRLKAVDASECSTSDSRPACFALTVSTQNVAVFARRGLFAGTDNSNAPYPKNHHEVDYKAYVNFPYASIYNTQDSDTENAGNGYQDKLLRKKVSLFSHSVFAIGLGHTSSNLIPHWQQKLGLDEYAPKLGTPCYNVDETPGSQCTVPRSSNNMRYKLLASYLTQTSRFSDLISNLSHSVVTHHGVFGFIYENHIVKDQSGGYTALTVSLGPYGSTVAGYVRSAPPYVTADDQNMVFDLRPQISVQTLQGESNFTSMSVKRTLASMFSALEGSVFAHELQAVDTVSTASKFAWATRLAPRQTDGPETLVSNPSFVGAIDAPASAYNPTPSKFFLITPNNYDFDVLNQILEEKAFDRINVPERGHMLNAVGGTPLQRVNSNLFNYTSAGYSVVVPSETFLGPGPRRGANIGSYSRTSCIRNCINITYSFHNPHPSRGGALVAWQNDVEKVSHAIIRPWGVTKGGGLSGDAASFDLPSLKEANFPDPSEKPSMSYGVDPKTGRLDYTTGSLLSVGNAFSRNQLSFDLTLNSGLKSPEVNQWRNTYYNSASMQSSGLEALGMGQGLNAVSSFISILYLLDAYNYEGSNVHEVIAREVSGPLIMNWWEEASKNNVFTLNWQKSSQVFYRRPSGEFTPPLDQLGARLSMSGEPTIVESIPNIQGGNPPRFKSYYSRKWKMTDVEFELEDINSKTKYAFVQYHGAGFPTSAEDFENAVDKNTHSTKWLISNINFPMGRDLKFNYSTDIVTEISTGEVNNAGEFVISSKDETLKLGHTGEDNYSRTAAEGIWGIPHVITNADGTATTFKYYRGFKVEEGAPYNDEGAPVDVISNDNSIVNIQGLHEFPFLGISEVYEPGKESNVDEPTVTITYNGLNQVSSVTDASGQTMSYASAMGRVSRVVDGAGAITITKYDEYGRLIETITPEYNVVEAQ